LLSFVLFRVIYYTTPDHYSPSEKLLIALNVTRECGAEAIAYKYGKTMQHIYSPDHIPLLILVSLN